MRIRIAYLTDDEVNHTLALRMALECGSLLVRTRPGCVPPGGTLARLHDLDHMSPRQKKAILENLLSAPPRVPVAVHSYNLEEEEMETLRVNGVIVSRSLETALVLRLCQASDPDQEPLPVEGDRDDVEDPAEPAALCSLVRSLASQAHKTVARATSAPHEEWHALRQEIDCLQKLIDRLRRLHALRFEELQRWLDSLLLRVANRDLEESVQDEPVALHHECSIRVARTDQFDPTTRARYASVEERCG